MKSYIMALDQGTTSSRCILFDVQGKAVSQAQKEFRQFYPKPGWVEHDPMEIWSTQLGVAIQALSEKQLSGNAIAAIGITNQRETTLVWETATGKPIYPAIVWQCRRSAPLIQKLLDEGYGPLLTATTGLIPDAYFSATKLAWLLDNIPGSRERAARGELQFGTIDTWLIWNLTGGKVHCTDYTNASRTMLFDIHRLCWSSEICRILNIPMEMLPKVCSNSEIYGYTDCIGLPKGIPICGAAGDQQAALFGQGCFQAGEAKNTYGTGCFLLMNTGDKPVHSRNGLLTTLAYGINGQMAYALEGSVFIAGAAIQWLRDELQLIRSAAESEEAAARVPDTNGAYLVPAFSGLGAPYWNAEARGTITGLTRGTNRNHIIRAALESIAYQTADILRAMERDCGMPLQTLQVDGGASANNFLLQFQADVLHIPVNRPPCVETTARGAAFLAGLAVGYYPSMALLRELGTKGDCFCPSMEESKRKALLDGWKDAVSRTLYQASDEI